MYYYYFLLLLLAFAPWYMSSRHTKEQRMQRIWELPEHMSILIPIAIDSLYCNIKNKTKIVRVVDVNSYVVSFVHQNSVTVHKSSLAEFITNYTLYEEGSDV